MNKVLIVLLMILHPAIALAAVSVEMTVDRTQVAMGESLGMQVKVTGSKSAGEPQISGLEAFQVTSTGSSSQVQIVNSSVTSSKVFQYQLSPLKSGLTTLGPASVTVDGETYRSQPVTIAVSKEAAQAPADSETSLRVELSTTSPYIHSQVLCTLRFESRVPIANAELAQPEFAGFWKEKLGDVSQHERVVNGQQWVVNEIKWALFPTRAGTVTIPPIRIAADVVKRVQRRPGVPFDDDPFLRNLGRFGGLSALQETERRVFSSQPVTLEVKALPAEGRPSNFSGLVGKFGIQERASQTGVGVGESVTLTLTVSGSGNVRDIPSPTFAALKDFKVYDDEPKVSVQAGANGIVGTKTFTKAIVPLKEGELTIPPFELPYFDPEEAQYKMLSTQAVRLTVNPSDQQQSSVGTMVSPNSVAKTDVMVVGHDVMPIVQDAAFMTNDGVTARQRGMFFFMVLLPALGALASWVAYRRLLHLRSDSGFLRRNQARRAAKKKIQKLSHIKDAEFCRAATLILKEYIGDKLNVDGRALTAMDIEKLFGERSLSEAATSVVRSLLSEFDAGIYGGRQVDASRRKLLTVALERAVESMERGAVR